MITADHTSFSAANNNTLAAPHVAYPFGYGISPASPALTVHSTSPSLQGLSPVTPSTPYTSISSPDVQTQAFQSFQGNQNEVNTSGIQSNTSSLSRPREYRAMHHACSQPNLRASTVQSNSYRPTTVYTHSPTDGHHVPLYPYPSPVLSNWASPSTAYSHLDVVSTSQHESIDQTSHAYPYETHQDYTPSSYSTLAGAVPMTAAMTGSGRSPSSDSSSVTIRQPTQSPPNNMIRSTEMFQAVNSATPFGSYGSPNNNTHYMAYGDMPNGAVDTYPQPRHGHPSSTHQDDWQRFEPMHDADWHLAQMSFNGLPTPGPVVPQVRYRPATASDHRRYVVEADLYRPIYFTRNRGVNVGVSLTDALQMRLNDLDNGNTNCLEGCGPSISLRLIVSHCCAIYTKSVWMLTFSP